MTIAPEASQTSDRRQFPEFAEVPATGGRRTLDVLWIMCVALSLNTVIAQSILHDRPAYLYDSQLQLNPDARHYMVLGRNIWIQGVYSRCSKPPYVPDAARVPIYPSVAGAIDVLFDGVWAVYVFQVLCHVATAALVYWFAAPLFGRGIALIAGLLTASDAMLAVCNFEAMSEPLFCTLSTAAILYWMRTTLPLSANAARGWSAVIAGMLLAAAILTRPTALYLPFVLLAIEVVVVLARRDWRLLNHGIVLAGVTLFAVLPWAVRNYKVHGIPAVSKATNEAVYNCGACAYAVELGISRDEAQEVIRKEFSLPAVSEVNNPWTTGKGVKELLAAEEAVKWSVLLKYPRSLVVSCLRGLGKAAISHNVSTLADMGGQTWTHPGLTNILQGRFQFFLDELSKNSPMLVALFVWEVTFAVLVGCLGTIGLVGGIVNPRFRLPAICLLLVAAYYGLTIALVGCEAYSRYRTMVVPIWCVAAAIAFVKLGRLRRGTV